jgi:membrane protein YdbS with pleckstrin-like domain
VAEPAGFRGIERYLLPTERRVIAVRRHWARLGEPSFSALAGLVALFWIYHVLPQHVPVVPKLLMVGWLVLAVRALWHLLEWREDLFVVTDRRFLVRSGLITQRVSMMPLVKVTDLSFTRPPLGRLFGYGEIVIESAGQDQPMRRIQHLPNPDALYLEICDLLFGPKTPVPDSAAQPL